MSEGFQLRIQYAKRGRLAYLSHLETIRSVERIIRRAQLPYAITEGFNPHMKIAFGPALPVGAGGLGEYVDVRMKDYVAPQEALRRLQAAAAPNLYPLACNYIDVRADAITVEYPISAWEAEFTAPAGEQAMALDQVAEVLEQAFAALVNRGFIEVVRKKKKPKTVEFEGRLVVAPTCEVADGRVVVRFSTKDWGQGALRPDKFIDAALEQVEARLQLVKLMRVELQREDSEE